MKSAFNIEPPILEKIVQRLAEVAGIDRDSLETRRITWTVERRCRHLSLPGPSAYLAHLESSAGELDHLIDALVIHETRFFRDPAVFNHLHLWAREMAADCASPLRILSAPCSTGQEAYSLAAVLCNAGISSYTIYAFDISHTALAVAQRGVYPAGALDNVSGDLQAACGTLGSQHWHMRDELRGRIRFERRNLAHPGAFDGEPGYHLILCRNLFIYLHKHARAVLADNLRKVLLPGGRLIVGAGDRVAELNARFAPLKPAAGFGFTHLPAERPNTTETATSLVRPVKATVPRIGRTTPTSELDAAPATPVEFYSRALEYMERGNVRQAERRCRQALYLAPAYLPALEMLQTLWYLHPNARLRRALSERIQRVRAGTDGNVTSQHQSQGETT
jgi:chemotaxis protein methyltransferase WspC